jgi:very-short-patch-repair endonuclease
MSPPVPSDILTQARAQYGLVTLGQLNRARVSHRRRTELLSCRFLEPVHRGVYRLGSHDVGFEQSCLAACLALPDAVVSGPSAGRLLGLRRMPTGPVHVLTKAKPIELTDVIVHRTTTLGPADWMAREDDGIRMLRPVRLAVDLARFLDDHDLESVIEQLIDRGLASIPALHACGRRLAGSGRDGIRRFGRVVNRRPVWNKPKDSDLEVRLFRALAANGVVLETQVRIDLGGGHWLHLDGADRERRFGVEVDHVTWHGGRLATQQDKWRDRQAMRLGWLVARVTDEDIEQRLNATVAEICEIHRLRAVA